MKQLLLDEFHLYIYDYVVNKGGKCYTPEFGKEVSISPIEFDKHADDLVEWGYFHVKKWEKHGVVFKDYWWSGKEI